jgi:hypothetical protein
MQSASARSEHPNLCDANSKSEEQNSNNWTIAGSKLLQSTELQKFHISRAARKSIFNSNCFVLAEKPLLGE